jgi:endonuclease YncB( thermonuclease family)
MTNTPDYGGCPQTWRGFLLGLLIFAMAVALIIAYARAAEFAGSVDKVIDGDTFWLCDAMACHKIRLCGIDAPEEDHLGYHESSEALKELVAGKTVRCVQVGNGTPCDGRSKPTSRDRIVAQCFVADTDLAAELVAKGAACDWIKFTGGHYSSGGSGNQCLPGHRQR